MNTVDNHLYLLVKDRYTPQDIERYFAISDKFLSDPKSVTDEEAEFYMTLDTYATSRRLLQSA